MKCNAYYLRSMQPLSSEGLVHVTIISSFCTLDVSTTAFAQLSVYLVIVSSWRSKIPTSAVSFAFLASADMRNLVNFRCSLSVSSTRRVTEMTGNLHLVCSHCNAFYGIVRMSRADASKYLVSALLLRNDLWRQWEGDSFVQNKVRRNICSAIISFLSFFFPSSFPPSVFLSYQRKVYCFRLRARGKMS